MVILRLTPTRRLSAVPALGKSYWETIKQVIDYVQFWWEYEWNLFLCRSWRKYITVISWLGNDGFNCKRGCLPYRMRTWTCGKSQNMRRKSRCKVSSVNFNSWTRCHMPVRVTVMVIEHLREQVAALIELVSTMHMQRLAIEMQKSMQNRKAIKWKFQQKRLEYHIFNLKPRYWDRLWSDSRSLLKKLPK